MQPTLVLEVYFAPKICDYFSFEYSEFRFDPEKIRAECIFVGWTVAVSLSGGY